MRRISIQSLFVVVLATLVACGKSDKTDDKTSTAGQAKALEASKVDLAMLGAKKLAFEGYPVWAMNNPDKACPDKIDELLDKVDMKSAKDPWGNDYKMFCGANLPAGAKGLAILSFGPDGKEGTSDDIKSWS